jgi:hypothetical protein
MTWAPDYITTDELADFLRVDDLDDEVQLGLAVASASRAIDRHTNRQFGLVASAEERLYTAYPDYERGAWVVEIDDLMTTTDLAIEVTDVGTLTDYRLEPVNAAAEGKPWTRIRVGKDSSVQPTGEEYEIAATGRWGWTDVPEQVKQATCLQGSRFMSRRDSPYGIAGSPDQGSELRLLARVDPDVAVALRGLVRPRRGA